MSHYTTRLYFWHFVFCIVYAQNDTIAHGPAPKVFRFLNGSVIDNLKVCDEIPCLLKCCPKNQVLLYTNETRYCANNSDLRLTGITNLNDYSKPNVEIHKKNMNWTGIKTEKKVTDFTFIYSENISIKDLNGVKLDRFLQSGDNYYLLEDGRIRFVQTNDNQFDLKLGDFCFEHQIYVGDNDTSLEVIFIYLQENGQDNEITTSAVISTCLMLTSCFFMLLVILVYALLKELRNPAGVVLMATIATLTASFFIKAVQSLLMSYRLLDSFQCGIFGVIVIYFILASFTWMNVMSFDIWWTMRGFHTVKKENHRGVSNKFYWYCLYGWGVPLAYTLFIIIIDYQDLSHLPSFIKPHLLVNPTECFLTSIAKRFYLFTPILVTVFINVVFFVMTAYNIFRIKHGAARGRAETKRNENNENRYIIYIKLSLVMGISWLLDVLSSEIQPDSQVWVVADLYNALLGLFLFITFVAKRKIVVKLCKRLGIFDNLVEKWGPTESKYGASSYGATKGIGNKGRSYSDSTFLTSEANN